ncbi:Cro/CI family transcriptional regulator [Chitiniphilus eburneus]|uniref:Cro/CI family transcriptional regulator n=1 Tax=Chitiniphilus eburneus TaxID=2571148 RepID=UPI001B7F842A|nr:Cro/CI family transcriptional regulator [Chitiniphilus eburneus]
MKIKTSDAIALMQGRGPLARLLGITWQAVDQWGEYVPELRAYQLVEKCPAALSLVEQCERSATT